MLTLQTLSSLLLILIFFGFTGFGLFILLPPLFKRITNTFDRILLAPFMGAAFYTLFFMIVEPMFGILINFKNLAIVFCMLISGAAIYSIGKTSTSEAPEKDMIESGKFQINKLNKVSIISRCSVILLLFLVFAISLDIRLDNARKYPDKLLDSDPYRHEVRTDAMIKTGHISPFDPLIVGETPIFELQGCYVLTTIIALLGNFNSWQIWMWGAQFAGAFCIFSMFLFAKYAFKFLQEELNLWKDFTLASLDLATVVGIIAASLLGASPVHLLRTNMGFSEAFALIFLPLVLLYYLFAAKHHQWTDFVLFGLLFTAFAFNNPVPAVFAVPLFTVHALWMVLVHRKYHLLWGFLLSAAIFAVWLVIWDWKILATPLLKSFSSLADTGTRGIMKDVGSPKTFIDSIILGWKEFKGQAFRNISTLQFVLGFTSLTALIVMTFKKLGYKLSNTSAFLFFNVWFLTFLLFLIPMGYFSFTMYYYRHFIVLAHGIALMSAIGCIWAIQKIPAKNHLPYYIVLLLLGPAITSHAKPWGNWMLNCSPEEYAAADWIKQNTSPEAIVIANWYTGDYLRSLTKRRTINSDYNRDEVAKAKKMTSLNIVTLAKQPEAMLAYIQKNPGDYYLVTSKWGPWGKYDLDPHFQLMQTNGKKEKELSKVYKIHP